MRQKLVIATKVAGPSRGMPWIRGGSADLTGADIIAACDASLERLQTDVIDLYQIHWPARHVPMFGGLYYNPKHENPTATSIHAQLEALGTLVKAGKVRAVGRQARARPPMVAWRCSKPFANNAGAALKPWWPGGVTTNWPLPTA